MGKQDMAALVGSRICHDLVSPLGAIGNGLELLGMSGPGHSPELDLIADSVRDATARIRLLRVAFGAHGSDQLMSAREASGILAGVAERGRYVYGWRVEEVLHRDLVRVAFLTVLCLEATIPAGGTVVVSQDGAGLTVEATGRTDARACQSVWDGIARGEAPAAVSAAQVQFALLPAAVAAQSMRLDWQAEGPVMTVRLQPT
ncbi:MAG: histidine phosphotransferase family protein [Paracoccaceae bacterium]